MERAGNRAYIHTIRHSDLFSDDEDEDKEILYREDEYLSLLHEFNWVYFNKHKLERGDIIKFKNSSDNIFALVNVLFSFFQIFFVRLLNSINITNEQIISPNNHIYLFKNRLIDRINNNITEVIVL